MKNNIEIIVFLEGGEKAKITCYNDDLWISEIYENFLNCVSNGSLFNEDGWTSIKIDYRGNYMSILNCKKVLGWI